MDVLQRVNVREPFRHIPQVPPHHLQVHLPPLRVEQLPQRSVAQLHLDVEPVHGLLAARHLGHIRFFSKQIGRRVPRRVSQRPAVAERLVLGARHLRLLPRPVVTHDLGVVAQDGEATNFSHDPLVICALLVLVQSDLLHRVLSLVQALPHTEYASKRSSADLAKLLEVGGVSRLLVLPKETWACRRNLRAVGSTGRLGRLGVLGPHHFIKILLHTPLRAQADASLPPIVIVPAVVSKPRLVPRAVFVGGFS
mmetsp:Transcript_15182/g.51195  ORF Transcript_15182/g.51195 Transcript_15182/m.51195 type:complete len:252 (+) Transcript_15182:797-1552(+)